DRSQLHPRLIQQIAQSRLLEQRREIEIGVLTRVSRGRSDRTVGTDQAGGGQRQAALAGARVLAQGTECEHTVLTEQLHTIAEIEIQTVEDLDTQRVLHHARSTRG